MSDPTTISPARSNEEEPIVHLRLGDQEIWILPDALLVQDTKLYALEASKEELENLLSQTGLSHQLRLWVCPILVKSGTDYILIDTGIGLHVPGMACSRDGRCAPANNSLRLASSRKRSQRFSSRICMRTISAARSRLQPGSRFFQMQLSMFRKQRSISGRTRISVTSKETFRRSSSSSRCESRKAQLNICRSQHSLSEHRSFLGLNRSHFPDTRRGKPVICWSIQIVNNNS